MTANRNSKGMTRGDFLKAGGAVALTGAAMLGIAGCSNNATASTESDTEATVQWDHEADVVVVGSGAGGFTTALLSAQKGLKTILVEISKTTGGGSSFCGGILYNSGGNTVESYNKFTQYLGDHELARKYVLEMEDWLHWMVESGLAVVEPKVRTGYLEGVENFMLAMGWEEGQYTYGCREFFDSFEDAFAAAGGTLLLETRGEKILTDGEDRIIGLRAKTSDDRPVKIKSKVVVLATGGFQGDSELRCRYLGPQADLATILAVPYATGNGLKMAEEVGASLGGAMSSFSATFTAAFPAVNYCTIPDDYETRGYDDEGKYWLYGQHFSLGMPEGGILVNIDGERYVDEDEKFYRVPQTTIKQRRSTGIIIADAPEWEQWRKTQAEFGLPFTVGERLDNVICTEKSGGKVFSADSIAELADVMNATNVATYMVDKENLLKTIEEYNAAMAAGEGSKLRIPRAIAPHKPIAEGPFYAFPIRPSIYATWGGVAINGRSQVLDKNKRPILGLYACAPTAGGIMREVYSGAIGTAGTTGYWAGNAIAEDIASL